MYGDPHSQWLLPDRAMLSKFNSMLLRQRPGELNPGSDILWPEIAGKLKCLIGFRDQALIPEIPSVD